MGKNLLIDIGNTNIKLAETGKNGSIAKVKFFPYKKDGLVSYFIKALEGYKNYDAIGVSLADPKLESEVSNILLTLYGLKAVIINKGLKLPIKIRYKSSLGSDRICSCAAVYSLYKKKNILIIDFGTATTYNMLVNDMFIGGMISPGIRTSLNSLLANSILPDVKLTLKKNLIADNTNDAIANGVLYQSIFAADRVITDLKKKYRGLFVAATGGFSSMVGKNIKNINTVDKDLVLKGINIILEHGKDQN